MTTIAYGRILYISKERAVTGGGRKRTPPGTVVDSKTSVTSSTLRVALCFWGASRSLSHTYHTHHMLLEPLRKINATVDVFLHTYTLNEPYSNYRTKEANIKLNNTEFHLINYTAALVDNKEVIDRFLNIEKYKSLGDPWDSKWSTFDNHIRALYSMRRLTDLWDGSLVDYVKNPDDKTGGRRYHGTDKLNLNPHVTPELARVLRNQYYPNRTRQQRTPYVSTEDHDRNDELYDVVIYARPDVLYLTPIQPQWLYNLKDDEIYLPNFSMYPINDRFAIGTPRAIRVYGQRFDYAAYFADEHPLHSESFLDFALKTHNITPRLIPFCFHRRRASGDIWQDCVPEVTK